MYRTTAKRLSLAFVVCGLTATLALAQASGGVGAAGGRGTMATSSGTLSSPDMRGTGGPVTMPNSPRPGGEISNNCAPGTGVGAVACVPTSKNTESTDSMQVARNTGSTQQGQGIAVECEPGTGVGAVACIPKEYRTVR